MKPIPSLFSLGLVRWGLLGIFILLLYARLLLPTLVLLFLFLSVEGIPFWSQSALRKLTSSNHVQPTRLFAGEASVLTLSLQNRGFMPILLSWDCLLYTSDAADEEDSVDLGG